MSLYLLPPAASAADEVQQLATAAGARFINAQTVRDVILADSEGGVTVARVPVPVAKLIGTFSDMLFAEVPTLVMAAPSSTYTEDFKAPLAMFPWNDWSELETKLAKTGTLSNSPAQAAKQLEGQKSSLDRRLAAQLDPKTDRSLIHDDQDTGEV